MSDIIDYRVPNYNSMYYSNIEIPAVSKKIKKSKERILTDENFKEALNEIEISDDDGMEEIMAKLKDKGWIEQKIISGAGITSTIDYSMFEPGKSYNDLK